MAEVRLEDGEGFDQLLRRFNKRVQQEGLISRIRRNMYFIPETTLRKQKAAKKRRKSIKAQRKYM